MTDLQAPCVEPPGCSYTKEEGKRPVCETCGWPAPLRVSLTLEGTTRGRTIWYLLDLGAQAVVETYEGESRDHAPLEAALKAEELREQGATLALCPGVLFFQR